MDIWKQKMVISSGAYYASTNTAIRVLGAESRPKQSLDVRPELAEGVQLENCRAAGVKI